MASSLGFMTINETEQKPESMKFTESLQQKMSSKKARDLISKLHENEEVQDDNSDDEDIDDHEEDPPHVSEVTQHGSYVNQYHSTVPQPANTENEVISKINYMIQMLEENNDDKINSVTEEMILYCFLGIFTIFMIESFTKIEKYVR